jgi:hypothetical protein
LVRPDLKDIFIENEGEFQKDKKCWYFKKEKYLNLLQRFSELARNSSIGLEPIPTFVFHALSAKIPFQRVEKNATKYDYSKDTPVFLYFNR